MEQVLARSQRPEACVAHTFLGLSDGGGKVGFIQ